MNTVNTIQSILQTLKDDAEMSFEAYNFELSIADKNSKSKRTLNTINYAHEMLGRTNALKKAIRLIERQLELN